MALDVKRLNSKLDFQNQDYWLHIQADTKLDKYPAKQHARAVATKLGVSSGLLLLAGEKATLLKDSDQLVPFRQRRYFYYLTGCNESDCYVTYNIADDLLTLYIPKVDLRHAVWGGAGSTKIEAFAKYDVDAVEYTSELRKLLSTAMKSSHSATIYLRHDSDIDVVVPAEAISSVKNNIDTWKLKGAIDQCRVIKFPHEIALIRRANAISAKAHRAVLENIRSFKNERQVEGLFLDTCISAGAHNQAYSIIAGAGSNAAILHYVANNAAFDDSQVILVDAGAEYDCYASDVTRTFPISGHWSPEAKAIYDAVEDMQTQCIARIRPGVHFRDLQVLSMAIATRWLLKLGIFHNGSLEEILQVGTIRAFFPHGLGHHVGLEVHDVLNIPIQTKTKAKLEVVDTELYEDTELAGLSAEEIKDLYDALIYSVPKLRPIQADGPHLEPGMVVTVEPGLYFSEFALSKVYLRDRIHAKYINKEVLAKYMPVGGVRIEDDILVTTGGYENLTTAPKGDEALKIIRGEVDEMSSETISANALVDLATPFTSRSAPFWNKGKAPVTSTPRLAEPKDEKTSQLCSELSAKCSIDVKQKLADCLPPRAESESLIYSFPFATAAPSSQQPERSDSQLLNQMLHKQAELNCMIKNATFERPDLWTRQLQYGRESLLESVAMQKQLKDLMTRLRNMHRSLEQWRNGSDLTPRSESSHRAGLGSSSTTRSDPSTTTQEPNPASVRNTWEEPLALSANQEKILTLLRAMAHDGQGLDLSYISREAGLAEHHARIILEHLGSRGLARMSRSGNKFKAVGPTPRLTNPEVSESTEVNANADVGKNPLVVPEPEPVSLTIEAPSSQLVTALHDFKQDDDQRCLVFEKGDVILITERNQSGWCLGLHRRSGKLGWLPANYVEETVAPVTSPSPVEVPGRLASVTTADNDEHAQIRQIAIKERLQSAFSQKLASLLLPSRTSSNAIHKQSILDALIATEDAELPCFSGLCMQAKQMSDAIDFTTLEGSGIHKLKKLYEKVDKALALEFEPDHLFHRLAQEERDELFRTRWKVLGVKEETAEQFGICGACSVCRQGFVHWDENWLADKNAEDDDDE